MAGFVGWFLVAAGAFSMAGAALDWSLFMESRKARFFVRLLGRNGARIAYLVLGAALLTLGLCGLFGVIELKSRRWG